MSTDYYDAEGRAKPRRSLFGLLFIPILAFIAGVAGTGWLLANWSQAASYIGIKPAAQRAAAPAAANPPVTIVPEPETKADSEPERLVIDPEISRRVMRLEQRLGQVDVQTRAAAGNADRAEGLLVAFAARRALDRGVGLGYLEGLLRERFGATQAPAVATVITASRRPITLQALQEGLQKAGPDLTGGSPNQSWWSAFKTEMADLITIRRSEAPASMPAERLERASLALDAGQVEIALTEVLRLPGRDKAGDWIVAARRYVAARRALDALETAALLEPRVPTAAAPAPRPAPPPPAASPPGA
jgi:hypothetical protein